MAIVPVYPSLAPYTHPLAIRYPFEYPAYWYPAEYQPTYPYGFHAARWIDRASYYSIYNPGNFWIWGPSQ